MLCGDVDDAEREQWHWMVELLDSVERAARRSLHATVLVEGSPSSGLWPSTAAAAPPREFDWQD
jgi:hypothetical protein